MSPCLRRFIETLFDEVVVEHGASWRENREFEALSAPGRPQCSMVLRLLSNPETEN
jgi:hypothetical protein